MIIEHEILDEGVKKVSYSNGVTIYVNESNQEVQVGTILLEPLSYELEGVN